MFCTLDLQNERLICTFGLHLNVALIGTICTCTNELNVWSSVPGPALSRCNRCSCIGPRASVGPAPWCLGRLFILPYTPCAWEFSRNAM